MSQIGIRVVWLYFTLASTQILYIVTPDFIMTDLAGVLPMPQEYRITSTFDDNEFKGTQYSAAELIIVSPKSKMPIQPVSWHIHSASFVRVEVENGTKLQPGAFGEIAEL